MSNIIASTYEILQLIGAGGGGNVYLANHIRLNKKVVLKADKRKITTRPELLRREVDILKNLSHSYIPQVYDFFVENDIVYTVMDFIEGESLDRPLKRGERFSQPQVIKWAKQLLEALCYLHSPTHGDPPRGFVHSDIKPANLMLTQYGDICLIDFNIALALGEENVVGCSAGYASPEHYGLDYSDVGSGTATVDHNKTVVVGDETVPLEAISGGTSKSSCKRVIPDVRSDIYSVGATLYHLLSGQRPAKEFFEVVPLSKKEYSPQIVDIISKAMNPNPDLRYQSAEEMLSAFVNLHKNDPRTKKHKLANRVVSASLVAVMILGAVTTFVGQKRIQTTESWLKLTEYAKTALDEGDVDAAIDYALQTFPAEESILTPAYLSESQKVLTNALSVYDLSNGFKYHKVVELPANPISLKLSPDGKYGVCIYSKNLAVFNSETSEIIVTLPVNESALSEVEFLDSDTIVYAGDEGITVYDILSGEKLWSGKKCTTIAVSRNKNTIAAVYRDESFANIYNAVNGELLTTVEFGNNKQSVLANDVFANPNDNLFELSADGNYLAVSFDNGSLYVFDLSGNGKDMQLLDESSGATHFEGGFYQQYLAFSASDSKNSVFAIVDADKQEQTGGFSAEGYYSVVTDENGIYVNTDNLLVRIDPVTGEQTPMIDSSNVVVRYSIGHDMTATITTKTVEFFDSNANLFACFDREQGDFIQLSADIALLGSLNSSAIKIMKLDNHNSTDVLSYDSSYSHDEARISADEKNMVLFTYDQFRLYDISGNLICEVEIPDSEQVYDQQFVRNDKGESYLEVTYNDGTLVAYGAVDGKIISKTDGAKVDSSLGEEYLTDSLRIVSPLHGPAVVYDKDSGDEICEISSEGYLTYVTQSGEYIVAQFVTTEGYYYGLLMNSKCEILAELPYLCDVWEGKLYFDYPSGNVRTSEIYSLDDLILIARDLKEGK